MPKTAADDKSGHIGIYF